MYVDKLTEIIRKLAKSNHYQTLYNFSKECNAPLFDNERDFTRLQTIFLTYLSFYHAIETDVYMGEVDESVTEDFIYEDAYMTYKNKERKKTQQKNTMEMPVPAKSPKPGEAQKVSSIQWNLGSKRKR